MSHGGTAGAVYKEQIVELVRGGRNARSLAQEFEPSEQALSNWVKQADLDEGRRSGGLTMRRGWSCCV